VTKLPWMPLDVAAYLADTGHLSTEEHGAYILLILHYWQHKSLPPGDKLLAQTARLSPKKWARVKTVLQPLFLDDWKHKRVEQELAKASNIRAKRVDAARIMHRNRGANVGAGAPQFAHAPVVHMHVHKRQSQGPPSSEVSRETSSDGMRTGEIASDDKTGLYQRANEILGKGCGGLVTKLLQAREGNVALARAVVETASTKANPREYIGGVIRGNAEKIAASGAGWDPGI
jgi:uncharacterized protein YdaU (DUF1376 family)